MTARFPYVEIDPVLGPSSAQPYIPITLEVLGKVASVNALVDSGAALNVLPYSVGVALFNIPSQMGSLRLEAASSVVIKSNGLAGSKTANSKPIRTTRYT